MCKVNKYIFFSSILLCILLCGCLGEKGHTMSPDEICDYMNENLEGDFELIDQEIQNDDDNDISTVYLKCSLFPEEIVITTQGYSWVGNEIGWGGR